MASTREITQLPDHVGEQVTVCGWVVTTRSSGKIGFMVVRDGTGRVQGVVVRSEVSDGVWEALKTLTLETSVCVHGTVRADQRSPGGVELGIADITIVGPSVDFPISKKEHGTTFLFEHRHLWLRSRRQIAIARIRHEIEQAIRDFLYDRRFTLVDTPILTGAIGESAGDLFETAYFDLGTAYLAQTGQLYVEAAAAALGKVYTFGPTFRAEKSKTRRHLAEFWMVEPEMAWHDTEDNMRVQEDFVSYIVARVLDRRPDELDELERDRGPLETIQTPFPRMAYRDAIDLLAKLGHDATFGDDLGGDDETALAQQFDRPVFVTNYPKAIKAFYMKEDPDDPRLVLCNDCLAPEGYGEIIGGSQREDDYDKLLSRIREQDLPESAYGWYLDLRRYGTFVHSGFGMGLERTVAWICGIPHVREAIAFPRQMHRLTP